DCTKVGEARSTYQRPVAASATVRFDRRRKERAHAHRADGRALATDERLRSGAPGSSGGEAGRRCGAAQVRGHANELGQRARAHLAHELAAVRLDRDLRDAELAADLLVQAPGDDQAHDVALAPA